MSSHKSNSHRDIEAVLRTAHFEPNANYQERLHARLLTLLTAKPAPEMLASHWHRLLFINPVDTREGEISMPKLQPIAVFSVAVLSVTALLFVSLVLVIPRSPEPAAGNPTPTATLSPIPTEIPAVQFGGQIKLLGCDIEQHGTKWTITLVWKAIDQPKADYSIFIRAILNGQLIAATDTILQGNIQMSSGADVTNLPTSVWWAVNGLAQSTHTLTLVPGDPMPDAIYIGLYDAQTGAKMPAFQGNVVFEQNRVMVWPSSPIAPLSDRPIGIPTGIVETLTATPDIAATVVAVQQPRVYGSSSSPDGQWRADFIRYECANIGGVDEFAYEQLKLVNVTNGDEQIVDGQLQSCGGVGASGLGGLFWSPNSRYFYYTDAREGVPDGGRSCWKPALIQYDVANRKTERLSEVWAPSTDGKTVAMWQEGDDLIIWSLDEGETGRIPIMWNPGEGDKRTPEAGICDIAWSPDGQQLAYVESACPASFVVYSVLHVNLNTAEQKVLVRLESDFLFREVQWETATQIKLSGYTLDAYTEQTEAKTLVLDPVTGELKSAP